MQVEWEFWTNSNDMCGAVCDVQREFIKVGHVPSMLSFWLCRLKHEARLSIPMVSVTELHDCRRATRAALPCLQYTWGRYCAYFGGSARSAEFARVALQEFVPVARELEGNWTRFTPHYIVWVCPESYRQSDECQSQCIHNGRYCTPDPDGDLEAGYSGRDIVQVWPAIQAKCLHLPFLVWLALARPLALYTAVRTPPQNCQRGQGRFTGH